MKPTFQPATCGGEIMTTHDSAATLGAERATRMMIAALMLGLNVAFPAAAAAQLDGARTYWTLPKNTNVIGVLAVSGIVNAAWTNVHRVQPTVDIANDLYMLTYTRSQPVFGRSALFSLILPAGSIATDASLPAGAGDAFVHGIGDPTASATLNLIGAPDLSVSEFLRYDHHTTVALNLSGTFPLGQYDADGTLNMGSNRSKLRVGLPIVHAIGAWVPGNRMTLEVLPSVTLLSNNGDAQGQTVETDPAWMVEAHLTRDITKRAFLSLDYSWIRLGESTRTDNTTGSVTGVSAATDAHLLGATANFEINQNLSLFITHMQTISEQADGVQLQGAVLKLMVSWAWHDVMERVRNLRGE